jgi:hypothetical protein
MMAATMTATTTLEPMTMTDAISDTWRSIRRRHRDVPAVALSIVHGPGSGHAGVDWDADPPSLRIGARTVADGPEAILGWLLHQAAHSLLWQRGERTRGTQGRYHSNDYAKAAEDVDLRASFVNTGVGWADTVLGDDLADVYAPHLSQLGEAMATWEPPGGQASTWFTAICACDPPRTIRLRGKKAADDLREHPIICSECGKPFIL